MKYFFDTEFIEGFRKPLFGKRSHFIDLISIGIVAENGRKFYQISCEYNYNDADNWVKENVILPLYLHTVSGDNRNRCTVENFHKFYGLNNNQIADSLKEFVYETSGIDNPDTIGDWDEVKWKSPIEFYAYYADYDWVLFCSLFGRMIDLPKGFPMYCKDLKQMLDDKLMLQYPINDTTITLLKSSLDAKEVVEIRALKTLEEKLNWIKKYCNKYPKQKNEHNALDDAKWNYELFKFIQLL